MIIINKVFLIGRFTKDPELNFGKGNGTAVCKFTLAVTRPFKKDETDFINCIAFKKAAETINQYMAKGNQIAVTGSIRTGSYDAKDGTKRYTTDVIIDGFHFIGNGQGNTNNNTSNQDNSFGEPIYEDDMPFK